MRAHGREVVKLDGRQFGVGFAHRAVDRHLVVVVELVVLDERHDGCVRQRHDAGYVVPGELGYQQVVAARNVGRGVHENLEGLF